MAGLALPYLLPEVKNADLLFKKYLNFLLAMMARREGASHVIAKPFDLSINPSTACQLNCPYCETGNGIMSRPATHLSPELHRRMISGVVDELFVIRYFGTGESLLNRRFTELLKQIEGKEIFTFITTNLSFKLDDRQIDELLHSGLNLLGVSLDGAEQDTYGRYRVGGNHELVVQNMLRMIERRNQLGLAYPLVQWRYLVFKHNEHEIPRVRQLATQYGVDLLEFAPGCAPGHDQGAVQKVENFEVRPSMSGPALTKAIRGKNTLLQRLITQKKFTQTLPPSDLKSKKCDWHYLGSYWYPDGGIGPCCIATEVQDDFGQVTFDSNFEGIWNGEHYKNARGLFNAGIKANKFCVNCRNKAIMDRFFNTSMRGVLLNAPKWVLKILSLRPELFFLPIDYYYLNAEIQTIVDNKAEFVGDYGDIDARMHSILDDSCEDKRISLLVELLAQPISTTKEESNLLSRVKKFFN